MSDNKENIEELIKIETQKRLEEMEDPSYVFPETINKVDVVSIIVMISISILLIVLCMLGVIR